MICGGKLEENSFFTSFYGQYSFEDKFRNSSFKFDVKDIDDLAALTSGRRLKDLASVTRRFKGQWLPLRLFHKEEMKTD